MINNTDKNNKLPPLTGERIFLREFRREDIIGMMSWAADVDTTKFLGSGFATPKTEEMVEKMLDAYLNGDAAGINLAIAEKDTERYIGQCSLTKVDPVSRCATLSIVLCPRFSAKGYGTEAVRLLIDYGFKLHNIRRVELSVMANNPAAIRCYEKCGFRKEGVARQAFFSEGAYVDKIYMGLLRSEWDM